jgi:hypothetical protein
LKSWFIDSRISFDARPMDFTNVSLTARAARLKNRRWLFLYLVFKEPNGFSSPEATGLGSLDNEPTPRQARNGEPLGTAR